jgi:hypothetical protein
LEKVEGVPGVVGVIIGLSYGGKSLGGGKGTGALRLQRTEPGGIKAVTQTAKGLQEVYIRVEAGREREVAEAIEALVG